MFTRVVHNSEIASMSVNWKHDWKRVNNVSYANVVKSGKSQSVSGVNPVKHDKNEKVVTHHYCHIPVRISNIARGSNQRPKIRSKTYPDADKRERYAKPIKTHKQPSQNGEDYLKTKNRFQILAVPDWPDQNSVDCDAVKDGVVESEAKKISTNKVVSKHKVPNTIDDKYDLELKFKFKHRQFINAAKDNTTFKKWNMQTDQKFGFVPLSDLKIPSKNNFKCVTTDTCKQHEIVRSSGSPNFLDVQLLVNTNLNLDKWEKYLNGYWDEQLLFLLKGGFPLDIQENHNMVSTSKNHTSALLYKNDVDRFLAEEKQHNAIKGPYKRPPFSDLHISPLLTREKANSSKRRVIMDLSFPKNASVNAHVATETYLGTKFILTLPTVDNIVEKVIKLGRGCMLYKVDIERAFRHVKVDPADFRFLGIFQDAYFYDTALAFGYRHGSTIFTRISDSVRYMMKCQGYDVINYIDDVVGLGVPSIATQSYHKLLELLQELGLDVNVTKNHPPDTCVTCLGINIDTKKFTLSVPDKKLSEIKNTCIMWKNKTTCSKKQLQSLLGLLLYISKCVKHSRHFLNRMLETLKTAPDANNIHLDANFRKDLFWFNTFLTTFNGTTFFNHRKIDATLEIDACLEGLGGRYGNIIYHVPIPQGFRNYNICHLEMINVLVSIRLWCTYFAHKKVLLKCDNMACVSVLNSGKTKDSVLSAIARNVQMILAEFDITLNVIHVMGKHNVIADVLSRWSLNQDVQRLTEVIQNPCWINVPHNILSIDWDI